MKNIEREKARELRRAGKSIKEIAREVGVSPGTVSVWVRDIPLTKEQFLALQSRPKLHIYKAIQGHRDRRDQRYQEYYKEAELEFEKLIKNPLYVLGLGLYIGEGYKYNDNAVGVGNADPKVIRKCIEFFELVGVKK